MTSVHQGKWTRTGAGLIPALGADPVRRAGSVGGGSTADGATFPGPFLNRTNGHNHGSQTYSSSGFSDGIPPGGTEGSSQPNSFHPGGLQVTLEDGAVRFISETVSIDVISASTTRNGGTRERKVSAANLK